MKKPNKKLTYIQHMTVKELAGFIRTDEITATNKYKVKLIKENCKIKNGFTVIKKTANNSDFICHTRKHDQKTQKVEEQYIEIKNDKSYIVDSVYPFDYYTESQEKLTNLYKILGKKQ